jgi:hypothetical protein
MGGRVKMRNFAGCLLLIVTALFLSARSEYAEARRSSLSTQMRAPLPVSLRPLASSTSASAASPPASHASLALISAAPRAAVLAALPTAELEGVSGSEVRRTVRAVAQCLPPSDYAWRLRVASKDPTAGTFTFSALFAYLRETSLVAAEDTARFSAAMDILHQQARAAHDSQELPRVYVVADLEADLRLREGGSAAPPPLLPPAASAPALLHPGPSAVDFRAAATAYVDARTFGPSPGEQRATMPPLTPSAKVYSSGKLPRLAPHRGCGRVRDGAREQYSTVTGYGAANVPFTAANKARIVEAVRDLPGDVQLLYLHPVQLLAREPGVGHSSAKETSARQGPAQRGLCSISLIVEAMKKISPYSAALKELRGAEGAEEDSKEEGSEEE